MEKKHGLIIVLSGPSGAGKGTLYNAVKEAMPELAVSISVTTRAPRPGEVEGINYYYVSIERYQEMIANGSFLETAEVYSNYYGTPKKPVYDMLKAGKDVLFELDTLGAAQMRRSYPECVTIFIMTPTFQELERRLRERGTESDDVIKHRLSHANKEVSKCKNYDYIVINDDCEKARDKIISIIRAEKLKMSRNAKLINTILGEKKL